MPKKKKEIYTQEDLYTREKEYKNKPKNEDERQQDKETPGISGKFSGR